MSFLKTRKIAENNPAKAAHRNYFYNFSLNLATALADTWRID
jgi:hypothetical protein